MSRRRVAPLTSITAVLAAGAALAASPTAGQWSGPGEGGALFTVSGSTILPAGQKPNRYIFAPSNFRCNSSNLAVKVAGIKIAGGQFSYKGPAYVDIYRDRRYVGRLVWSGKFTASRVSGRYRFRSPVTPPNAASPTFKKKKCDSGAQRWSATPGP